MTKNNLIYYQIHFIVLFKIVTKQCNIISECFDELPLPVGAYLNCTLKGRNVGSQNAKVGTYCEWRCRGGQRIGEYQTKCRSDRTWSLLSPPKCVGGNVAYLLQHILKNKPIVYMC